MPKINILIYKYIINIYSIIISIFSYFNSPLEMKVRFIWYIFVISRHLNYYENFAVISLALVLFQSPLTLYFIA